MSYISWRLHHTLREMIAGNNQMFSVSIHYDGLSTLRAIFTSKHNWSTRYSESQGWYCQISFNINFVFPYFALQKLTQTFAGRPIQSFCYPEQPQDQIYGEPHFSVAFIFSSKQVTYSGHWSWFPAPHRQWLLQYSIVNDSGCWAQP